MCIAVYKPANKPIPSEKLREMHTANPDGCGFMCADKGKIYHQKGYWDSRKFLSIWKRFVKDHSQSDMILHFRTAAASATTDDMCHPFMINKDLAFVHNGNLFEFQQYFGEGFKDRVSDTIRFNEQVLKKLPKDFLSDTGIRQCLQEYCESNLSKMIFLNANGDVDIINENSGQWIDGIWYSNGGIENYSGYGYSGAYYYNQGDVRHKGGLISAQMMPNKKDWTQCEGCLGYFPKDKLKNSKCDGCELLKKLEGFCQ